MCSTVDMHVYYGRYACVWKFTENMKIYWTTVKDLAYSTQIPEKLKLQQPHLRSKISNDDEFLKNILGQDVGKARLFDVVRRDINMIGSQM